MDQEICDFSANSFSRYSSHCPISILVVGDRATRTGDRVVYTVFPDFQESTVYDASSNTRNQRKQRNVVCPIQNTDAENDESIGPWWRILCVMEHDSHINPDSYFKLRDNTKPINILMCVLKNRKYQSQITREVHSVIPTLIITMPYDELIKNSPLLSVQYLARKRYVNIPLTISLFAEDMKPIFIPPSLRGDCAFLEKDQFIKFMDNFHKMTHEYPKKTIKEIFKEGLNAYDVIILLRIYIFSKYKQLGDSDHIEFLNIRLQSYRKIYPLSGKEQGFKITDSDFASFANLMCKEELNNAKSYADFWRFIRFSRWHLFWRDYINRRIQEDYVNCISQITWMNFEVPEIILELLEKTVDGNFFEKYMQYIDKACDSKCSHCRSNANGILEKVKHITSKTTRQYNILPYFKYVIGAAATLDPLSILKAKLKRYNPYIVDWSPTDDPKDSPGNFNSLTYQERLKAKSRSHIEVISRERGFNLRYEDWFRKERNQLDVPEPLSDTFTFSDIIKKKDGIDGIYSNQRYVTPLITKQASTNQFYPVLTDKGDWSSTSEYHKKCQEVSHSIYNEILTKENIQIIKEKSIDISGKIQGIVTPMDVASLLYHTALQDLLLEHNAPPLIRSEMTGCIHQKFNPYLSVFSLLFDIDTVHFMKQIEIFQIARAMHHAVIKLCIILKALAEENKEFSVQKLNEILKSERNCSFITDSRVYVYYSLKTVSSDSSDFHDRNSLPKEQFEGLDYASKETLKHLFTELPTKSLRLVITLPPNVLFANIEAFTSYKQILMLFLKGSQICPLLYHLSKNGLLSNLFDFQIYHNQCRMPHSGKYNGKEILDAQVAFTFENQLDNAEFIKDILITGSLSKVNGLMHMDPFPTYKNVSNGMLILPCSFNTNNTDEDSVSALCKSTSFLGNGLLSSKIDKEQLICRLENIETMLLEKCKQVDIEHVTDLDSALNIVVKKALCNTLSNYCGNLDIQANNGTNYFPQSYKTDYIISKFLDNCYISKFNVNNLFFNGSNTSLNNNNCMFPSLILSNKLVLIVSQSKSGKNSDSFKECIFINHGQYKKKTCYVQLRVGTDLSIDLQYYCFKSSCRGDHTGFRKVLTFCVN